MEGMIAYPFKKRVEPRWSRAFPPEADVCLEPVMNLGLYFEGGYGT